MLHLISLISLGLCLAFFQTMILNIKCNWFVLTPLSIIICFSISDKAATISLVVHLCSILITSPIMILWKMRSVSSKADTSKKQELYKNGKKVDVEQKTMTISEKASLYMSHIFTILIRTYAIGLIFYYIFNINVIHTTSIYAYNFLIEDFKFQIISVFIIFVISFILTTSSKVYKKRVFDLIYNKIQAKTLSPKAQQICNIIFASVIGLALTFLAYIILPIKSIIFNFIGDALHTGFTFGGLNICFIAAFIFNIVMFLLYPMRMVKKSVRQASNMMMAFILGMPISISVFGLLVSSGVMVAVDDEMPIVLFLGFNIILLCMEFLDIKKEKGNIIKEGRTIKN